MAHLWYWSPLRIERARAVCSQAVTSASSCGRVIGPKDQIRSADFSMRSSTPHAPPMRMTPRPPRSSVPFRSRFAKDSESKLLPDLSQTILNPDSARINSSRRSLSMRMIFVGFTGNSRARGSGSRENRSKSPRAPTRETSWSTCLTRMTLPWN